MELQVTIVNPTGKYKPMSCLVPIPIKEVVAKNYAPYRDKGVIKICQKRNMTSRDLKKYGYTQVKIRVYDPKKIEEENAIRYAEIKKQKFASGEWKPSKADIEKGLV